MSEFDKGALRYVFPEELLRYFDIVESGARTKDPLINSHKHLKYCFFVKIPKTLGFWNYT